MGTSIPAFHVSDENKKVNGSGDVFIATRHDALASGVFSVKVSAHFDPAGGDDYPTGSILIKADLSDSFRGTFRSTSIELINSHGKHNPTAFLTGRCKGEVVGAGATPPGLRYWLMIVNNSAENRLDAPDVVGFAIHDRTGARIAYGIGPVKPGGNFSVEPK